MNLNYPQQFRERVMRRRKREEGDKANELNISDRKEPGKGYICRFLYLQESKHTYHLNMKTTHLKATSSSTPLIPPVLSSTVLLTSHDKSLREPLNTYK